MTEPVRKPPKRSGQAADPRLDNAVEFIRRKGGIDGNEKTLVAEIVHAAGDRRHLAPGLIRKPGEGLSWTKVALLLHGAHYIHEPDEAEARELLVSVLHKWKSGLSDLHYTISGPKKGKANGSKSLRNRTGNPHRGRR